MAELKPRRKIFRLVGLLFPGLYVAGDALRQGAGRPAALALAVLFLLVMIPLEWTRMRKPGINAWLFRRFSAFTKEKERARTSSTTWFLLACLISLAVLPKEICIAALLLLVFTDPAAEIAGTRWGRTRLLGKSLEGTVSGFLAGLFVTLALPLIGISLAPAVAVAGALAASVCELLPLAVDDNFSVPLGAGAAMWLATLLLPTAVR